MAKVQITRKYVSDDGLVFDSKASCQAHEAKDLFKSLTMLQPVHIDEIINRSTEKGRVRGALIEKLAALHREKRMEDGDYQRRRRRSPEELLETEIEVERETKSEAAE